MDPYPRTWVEIDLPALAHNLSVIRRHLPPNTLVALVAKADAYGHGVVAISRHALRHGADWIAVATVQEGIELREAGIDGPLLVLSAVLEEEADQAVFYGLRLMIERESLGRRVSAAAVEIGRPAIVHIPIDTGMSRFGVAPDEVASLVGILRELPGIEVEGIATHFADSTENPALTAAQYATFGNVRASFPEIPIAHAANSGAIPNNPESVLDLVRVGIAAYGIDAGNAYEDKLRPVLCWKARVISVRSRPAGTAVGYGGTHICSAETRIATIGVGYGDGYPRSLSGTGLVEIHGHVAAIIGLVCMDQLMVDITGLPNVAVGDEAVLIGERVSAAALGRMAHTNEYEIPTRIAPRVPRRYRHETS